ncbi:hypothetical protein [Sodalis glossinidius]|uniref:hypothetical protein n=1 Tax=Sodalis glossinidius TaxID=63612 RepID=UPI0011D14AAE|nr:hypothetical protein [Sodalis glossinidius]
MRLEDLFILKHISDYDVNVMPRNLSSKNRLGGIIDKINSVSNGQNPQNRPKKINVPLSTVFSNTKACHNSRDDVRGKQGGAASHPKNAFHTPFQNDIVIGTYKEKNLTRFSREVRPQQSTGCTTTW